MSDKNVIARIYPSQARRVFGTVCLAVVGALMIGVAVAYPPAAIGWLIVLLLFGAVSLWAALTAWQATGRGLELTRTELRETGGRRICLIEDIRSVTSGALAFKPSNGFLLRLKSSGPSSWAPGLWWRVGRMVGVGGMTSGQEAKYMAEVLEVILAERK